MRVIVTGSRKWPDPGKVHSELGQIYAEHGPFTLVHGACATGADAAAHQWYDVAGRSLMCLEFMYRADWEKYGNKAGPIRNARMVNAGADLVLAFPHPAGSGTQNTISLAEAAGIEVRTFPWRT